MITRSIVDLQSQLLVLEGENLSPISNGDIFLSTAEAYYVSCF